MNNVKYMVKIVKVPMQFSHSLSYLDPALRSDLFLPETLSLYSSFIGARG
jgi:hypothetical protein